MKETWMHWIQRKSIAQAKKIYLALKPKPTHTDLLFITGCQRSGTTLMEDIFELDWNARCFGESSELSSQDVPDILRFDPLPSVKHTLDMVKASLIISKPLVESQNLPQLLGFFKNSKALWMFRHYKDVAASNLKFLGMDNGIKDIRPIVENQTENWRAENCAEHVRITLASHYAPDMNPYDAAVLFWYARNSLFFDLALDQDARVLMVKYEDLVFQPDTIMRDVYRHVDQPYPGARILRDVHTGSAKKGREIPLSPTVDQLAQEMQQRLEAAYQAQAARD